MELIIVMYRHLGICFSTSRLPTVCMVWFIFDSMSIFRVHIIIIANEVFWRIEIDGTVETVIDYFDVSEAASYS